MKKKYFRFLQFLMITFITGISYGQSPFIDGTPGTGKTWTVPDNVYSVSVQIWGAGGAGGGARQNSRAGSGGGGGGYTTHNFTVSFGQTILYTVGKGGTGSTRSGDDGTSTTLDYGPSNIELKAEGGKGGIQDNEKNNPGGAGGPSSGGTINIPGVDGENSDIKGWPGGNGGNSPNGGTGGSGRSDRDGGDGDTPGGGGGGGEFNAWAIWPFENSVKSGGDGGDGEVIITYTETPLVKIDFNGSNNYTNFKDKFDFTTNFSIELWIKRNNTDTNKQTLVSKRNANDSSSSATGYDFGLIDGKLTFNWNARGSIQATQPLGDSRWYHVAVTHYSGMYKLYIDGIEVKFGSGSLPGSNSFNALIGANGRASGVPLEYYNGSMDEVRIWKKALTPEQIREMMNQEIEKSGSAVLGSVLKLDIHNLNWADLTGYYQMNQGTTDITAGKLADNSGSENFGTLNNMNSMQLNTAPLPYDTTSDGNWNSSSTWLNGSVQQIPNSIGIDGSTAVKWNIVRTKNDVTTNRATTVLGLVVDNNRLSVTNDQPLYVNTYLKIDGTLKLEGESQLIQPEGSIVDYNANPLGKLERDQQGTGNKFNYNYWGSPVSNSGLASERTYTLNEVLWDGNGIVKWVPSRDASPTPTTPVTLSTRWLYIYDNKPDGDYEGWQRIMPDKDIEVGLGFIMKGGGASNTADKNYTFRGQPNNGTITIPIDGHDKATVVGNPYPSAIDSHKFMDDNYGVLLNGVPLLFWQQSPGSSTHVLAQYQGGYGHLTKTGGVIPVAPLNILNVGAATKRPQRYIPVGQGFFVNGGTNGGVIEFNNTQRIFKKESGGESIFFRGTENRSGESTSEYEDKIQRVRLAFKNPEGATRHLLLGFTPDDAATDGIDYGYDGLNSDSFPSDLSFAIAGKKFVIQGVGAFDINKKYPLDMTLKTTGNIDIALSELENFESPIDVYIHDALLDTYTKINDINFQSYLEKGNYTDRFSIAFKPDSTLSTIDQDFKEIQVKYLQKTDEIYVKTPAGIDVRQVHLINMAGQSVKSWNMTNLNFGQEFKIPVKDISEGNYILKVETSTNSYNKKMIIKF